LRIYFQDSKQLKIHVNRFSSKKTVFLPSTPVKVTSVTAEKKNIVQIFRPYHYLLSFEHGKYKWEIHRTYKEIKDVHKELLKQVESEMGHSCKDISPHDVKPEWPK